MKPHPFLTFSAVLLVLSLVTAMPASAAAHHAPSPKSGKTVPSTGHNSTPPSGGSGSQTQKQPPHHNQGPLTLPPY